MSRQTWLWIGGFLLSEQTTTPINWSGLKVYHQSMWEAVRGTSTSAILILVLSALPVETAGAPLLPQPGDRFDISYRVATVGTVSASGEEPIPFTQILNADIAATVLKGGTGTHSVWIDFAYSRVSIEVRSATESVRLDLFPHRMILDGTPLYDSEADSDEAPPVLVHLLNESFRMEIGPKGELARFRDRKKHRRNDAYLDLAEPIRSLWVEAPEGEPPSDGSWARSEPLRMLGDLLLLPSTATYRINSRSGERGAVLELTRSLSVRSQDDISLPSRIGNTVPGSLRFDALGPDLFASPPSSRFENFVVDSTETFHLRADWGFLESKHGKAHLAWTGSHPQIDGPRKAQRNYDLNRSWKVEVRPATREIVGDEVRYLLYGEKIGASPLDSTREID